MRFAADAHYNLGVLLQQHATRAPSDRRGALEHYEQALRCDADHALAHANAAVLHLDERDDVRAALGLLKRAVELAPGHDSIVQNFAAVSQMARERGIK